MDEYEEQYQRINWTKGPLSNKNIQNQVNEFWLQSGPDCINWLINRIHTESHIDILDGVVNILTDIGLAAEQLIEDALTNDNLSQDQRETIDVALAYIQLENMDEIPQHN